MDENKNEILEETENVTEEVTEEVSEEVSEEVAEEVAEETAFEENATEEAVEDSTEAEKYVSIESLIAEIKSLKLKNRVLSVILAVIIAALVIFAGAKAYMSYNPYNHMGFYNTSGMTIADMARMSGMTVEEIIEQYQLPDNVKENTYYDVIQYLMPTSVVVEMYGMDFETAKERFMFPDEVTGETLWLDAEATIPLSVYIGTGDTLANFVKEYNLPETVTEDTLWGEIREQVLKFEYERSIAPEGENEVEEVNEVNPEEVYDEPQAEETLSEEELAEIMAYLENASEVTE
ncbi:MAG: hypothetical protein ACI3XA_08625 [Clostridia bacterium]